MLNLANLSERDLSTIDTGTLTPAEWDALKREVVRRAHAGRSRLVLDLIGRAIRGQRPTYPAANTRQAQLTFSFDERR
jgi:hypothetical protein